MNEIVIEVKGGCVTSVRTNTVGSKTRVKIFDHDAPEYTARVFDVSEALSLNKYWNTIVEKEFPIVIF